MHSTNGLLFNLNHIDRIQRLRLLAIAPVLIVTVFNTGYQYLFSRALHTATGTSDWRSRMIENIVGEGLEPDIFSALVAGLVYVFPVLIAALLTAGIWERVFAAGRGRRFDSGFIYLAALFTFFMHPSVSLFHVVFGMSFGMVFARGIFGGEGRSFLSPVLVGVAVVQISFPAAMTDHPIWNNIAGYSGTTSLMTYHQEGLSGLAWSRIEWWDAFVGNTQGLMGTTSVAAAILGGAILVFTRVASLRLIVAHIFGLVVASIVFNTIAGGIMDLPWYWHPVLGSFAFGVIFLATDPSSSCVTNSGRWTQGIIAGGLIVLLRVVNPSHPDGVIPVLLLVSMLSPLIDHIVIWFNIRQRALRHGG